MSGHGQINSGEGDPRNWFGVSGRDANHRHAHTQPVPPEALLDDDPDLRMVWAPLHDDAPGCRYGACATDDHCSCQEEVDWDA